MQTTVVGSEGEQELRLGWGGKRTKAKETLFLQGVGREEEKKAKPKKPCRIGPIPTNGKPPFLSLVAIARNTEPVPPSPVKGAGSVCLVLAASQLQKTTRKKKDPLQMKHSLPPPDLTTHKSTVQVVIQSLE